MSKRSSARGNKPILEKWEKTFRYYDFWLTFLSKWLNFQPSLFIFSKTFEKDELILWFRVCYERSRREIWAFEFWAQNAKFSVKNLSRKLEVVHISDLITKLAEHENMRNSSLPALVPCRIFHAQSFAHLQLYKLPNCWFLMSKNSLRGGL